MCYCATSDRCGDEGMCVRRWVCEGYTWYSSYSEGNSLLPMYPPHAHAHHTHTLSLSNMVSNTCYTLTHTHTHTPHTHRHTPTHIHMQWNTNGVSCLLARRAASNCIWENCSGGGGDCVCRHVCVWGRVCGWSCVGVWMLWEMYVWITCACMSMCKKACIWNIEREWVWWHCVFSRVRPKLMNITPT